VKMVLLLLLLLVTSIVGCAVWKANNSKLVAYPPYRITTDGKTATAELGFGLAPVTVHTDNVTSQTLSRKPFGFVR